MPQTPQDVGLEEITKEQFEDFERVRQGGLYNMMSQDARLAADLDRDTHFSIMRHYETLMEKWPEVRGV